MGEIMRNTWNKALDGVRFVIACYKLRNVIKLMSRIETLSTSVGKAQANGGPGPVYGANHPLRGFSK